MRKPAQLRKPVEPKKPSPTYEVYESSQLVYCDSRNDGDIVFTGASLIAEIREFAKTYNASLEDIEVFNDTRLETDYYGDHSHIEGGVQLRVLKTYDWPVEQHAVELAKYYARLKKYQEKLVEYEAVKQEYETKLAEYTAWKAEQEKQKDLKLLKKLQKKYNKE